jgi:hypothetical protein
LGSVERRLKDDPELLMMWDYYQMCRETQLIIFEKPTGKKDGSKILSQVIWPTGFSFLPSGHFESEDYMLTRYFMGFLRGEREGALAMVAKKGR